jgi:hypothetical protein
VAARAADGPEERLAASDLLVVGAALRGTPINRRYVVSFARSVASRLTRPVESWNAAVPTSRLDAASSAT